MKDRLSRKIWIEHGFDVLRYEGHEKLKVEPMAKALGVSRGSFYWHFTSLGDFHEALLATWREENTLDIISQLEKLSGTQARISALIQMGIDTPQPLENGMRRWGGVNNEVGAALVDVDQIRTNYLAKLLIDTGLPEQIARDRAVLLTWAAIGRALAPGLVTQTSTSTGYELSKIFAPSTPEQ